MNLVNPSGRSGDETNSAIVSFPDHKPHRGPTSSCYRAAARGVVNIVSHSKTSFPVMGPERCLLAFICIVILLPLGLGGRIKERNVAELTTFRAQSQRA